uniref:Testis expressed 2, like n=1 Tax=Oreochromis niloticus TaxID=8128 RepID=A0A669DYW3_ORENI
MWNPKYPICIQLTRGAKSQEDEGEGGRRAEDRSPEPNQPLPTVLYLFGRTGREKEEWFRHFLFASMDTEREKERNRQSKYVSSTRGMRHIVNCTCDLAEYPGKSQTAWANALIGRIFWDFLREKRWADAVSHKIQKKLSKIRLPYFMNELTLTELDMGSSMPIDLFGVPSAGLWVELQLVYTGNLQMTLQTKFNLSKLGKDGGQETVCRPILSVLADSDEESSSAGSSDEEEPLLSEPQGPVGEKGCPPATEGTGGGKTGRKILRFVDKIAKSKYFQKATENEFIKKKFEEMSNTPLLLTVEVQELSGTLVVNIPPPPTDRIWYSFCVPPKLDLHVRPKLGEREVTFCHVTEWIERKLQDEFQKVLVLPNMDDIYLPLMQSGVDSTQASESQQSQSSSTESIERIPPEIAGAESD